MVNPSRRRNPKSEIRNRSEETRQNEAGIDRRFFTEPYEDVRRSIDGYPSILR